MDSSFRWNDNTWGQGVLFMAETIGWLTDKIIIAELKIYHTREQLDRTDADESHKQLCRHRLKVLNLQRNDLKKEISQLLKDMIQGKVKPKIYRQFKMYNDPRFRIKKT
jgi:hypothetical protein